MNIEEKTEQTRQPAVSAGKNFYPLNFKHLFEISPTPYLVLKADSPKFTIAAVNDCYLAATLTKRPDILGRGIFEVFPDNPNDASATGVSDLRTSLESVIQRKEAHIMSIQKYDIPLREDEGGGYKKKYWSPVNTPLFDDEGTVQYIVHRVEDVTEFMLFREYSSGEAEKVQAHTMQMEAEVLRNSHEVREVNQKLMNANTALESREQELAQANDNLQALDKSKTAFFNNVSHEFRTPLTLMLGPLEEALNDIGAEPDIQHERLEMVHRNTLRLKKLVNTLLDFARIEAGRLQASYRATPLSSYTQELASMFRSAIEQAGLELGIDCPDLSQPIFIDRDMWEKIISNLLSNAFKHTFEGSIRLQMREFKDHIKLTVQDTGIGIPAEHLAHLFERFHRVPNAPSRTHEGSGIGLAFVQELVKLHGGSIRVESEMNKGTVFTLSIPTGKAHLPEQQIEAEHMQASTALGTQPFVEEALHWLPEKTDKKIKRETSVPVAEFVRLPWPGISHAGKARVLLADDNADMRAYVYRLLKPYCDVETVSDGLSALAAARANLPDIILSDIMMPLMDGFEFLKNIRNDAALQSTAVILLSARAGSEAQVEGLEAGANDYLVKPFQAAELLARVKTTLDLQRVQYQTEMRERNAELEQRVIERTVELEAVNKELESFAYSVSHDLRAPLRGINGFSQVLLQDYQDRLDEDGKLYLDRICKNTQEMGELMNSLLSLCSINRSVLEKVEFNLSEMAETFFEDLKRQEPDRNVEFKIQNDMQVHADMPLIRAVVENLLGNAWKYTSKQKHAVIEFKQVNHEGKKAYCIQDNGAGFDMQYADKLFGAFQRLHSSSEFPGNGIGLATVARIVHRHGGQVWAEAEPNKGASFYFTLG